MYNRNVLHHVNTTDTVKKIKCFRDQQCKSLRTALLKTPFSNLSDLKEMEEEHWQAVMTHEEDGRCGAIMQWLELLTTVSQVKSSAFVSQVFVQPVLTFKKIMKSTVCPVLWSAQLTLKEFIYYLWWETTWLREHPHVLESEKEAFMIDQYYKDLDNEDEDEWNRPNRDRLSEADKLAARTQRRLLPAPPLQTLRDEFSIPTQRDVTAFRRDKWENGDWTIPYIWISPALVEEVSPDVLRAMPAEMALVVIKIFHGDKSVPVCIAKC
jgi:hypothetical protein